MQMTKFQFWGSLTRRSLFAIDIEYLTTHALHNGDGQAARCVPCIVADPTVRQGLLASLLGVSCGATEFVICKKYRKTMVTR